MNNEQVNRAEKFVDEHLENFECPVCGSRRWGIHDNLVVTPNVQNGDIQNSAVAHLLLFCDNCSYVITFNAGHAGIV